MTPARIPDFSQPVAARPALEAVVRGSGSNTVTNNSKIASRFGTARRRAPTDGRFLNLPNEEQPGAIEPWQAVTPVRPDAAHSRGPRFLDTAGELLAAVAIIGGGMVLTGLTFLL